MEISRERVKYVDIFRGIGIVLMVLDHIGYGALFYKYVHAFHMPMFFFIAGFCYIEKNSVKYMELVKKKFISLIVPYLFFGIAEYIVWVESIGEGIEPLKHLLWVNTEGLAVAGALWFLTAIFFTDIMYFAIDRIQIMWIKHFIIVMLAICGALLPQCESYRLPYGLDAALVGLGLFHIGRLIKDNSQKKIVSRCLELKWYEILLLCAIVAILINNNSSVNMRTGRYGFLPLFWINAIVSIIALINISKLMDDAGIACINGYMRSVGCEGILYVALNQITIAVFSRVFDKINFRMNNAVKNVIITVCVLVSMHILSKIYSKGRILICSIFDKNMKK